MDVSSKMGGGAFETVVENIECVKIKGAGDDRVLVVGRGGTVKVVRGKEVVSGLQLGEGDQIEVMDAAGY